MSVCDGDYCYSAAEDRGPTHTTGEFLSNQINICLRDVQLGVKRQCVRVCACVRVCVDCECVCGRAFSALAQCPQTAKKTQCW